MVDDYLSMDWDLVLSHCSFIDFIENLYYFLFRIPPGQWWPSVVSVVCCPVEFSAMDGSLVQWNSTEYDVFECDRETS
jgi:hypothetical protein